MRPRIDLPHRIRTGQGIDPDPATSSAPYRIFNLGHGQPVDLMEFLATLERALGMNAERILLPMQAGDVVRTAADMTDLRRELDVAPTTSVEEGVGQFVKWYREHYEV